MTTGQREKGEAVRVVKEMFRGNPQSSLPQWVFVIILGAVMAACARLNKESAARPGSQPPSGPVPTSKSETEQDPVDTPPEVTQDVKSPETPPEATVSTKLFDFREYDELEIRDSDLQKLIDLRDARSVAKEMPVTCPRGVSRKSAEELNVMKARDRSSGGLFAPIWYLRASKSKLLKTEQGAFGIESCTELTLMQVQEEGKVSQVESLPVFAGELEFCDMGPMDSTPASLYFSQHIKRENLSAVSRLLSLFRDSEGEWKTHVVSEVDHGNRSLLALHKRCRIAHLGQDFVALEEDFVYDSAFLQEQVLAGISKSPVSKVGQWVLFVGGRSEWTKRALPTQWLSEDLRSYHKLGESSNGMPLALLSSDSRDKTYNVLVWKDLSALRFLTQFARPLPFDPGSYLSGVTWDSVIRSDGRIQFSVLQKKEENRFELSRIVESYANGVQSWKVDSTSLETKPAPAGDRTESRAVVSSLPSGEVIITEASSEGLLKAFFSIVSVSVDGVVNQKSFLLPEPVIISGYLKCRFAKRQSAAGKSWICYGQQFSFEWNLEDEIRLWITPEFDFDVDYHPLIHFLR